MTFIVVSFRQGASRAGGFVYATSEVGRDRHGRADFFLGCTALGVAWKMANKNNHLAAWACPARRASIFDVCVDDVKLVP